MIDVSDFQPARLHKYNSARFQMVSLYFHALLKHNQQITLCCSRGKLIEGIIPGEVNKINLRSLSFEREA